MKRVPGAVRLGRGASIRVRLVMTFGALILLLAGMAAIGAWRLLELSHFTTGVATQHLRVERVVGEWLSETRANSVRNLALAQASDPVLQRVLAPALQDSNTRVDQLQQEVEQLLASDEARRLFADVGQQRAEYTEVRRKIGAAREAGEQDTVARMVEENLLPASGRYVESIQRLADHFRGQVTREAFAATQNADAGQTLLMACAGGGILLALLAAWLITRSITRAIREAVATAERVAEGDLTVRITTTGRDEMGQLLRALGQMSDRLRGLVGEVAQGARTVADTSAQIAQGNIDLSQRTEEQAGTLEETASSIQELTTSVGRNAGNARQANDVAAAAADVARQGGEAVQQVVSTMDGISEASRKIADIIGVIDGIAFQTNLLALNAAVEAARAGDQGRGFAVVAGEVRTLAQRSAEAAREIKALIGDSVGRVQVGARQVAEAGGRMEEIVAAVQRVRTLVAQITVSSEEQSSGIEQVNHAVQQMEHVVQQNASLVEEAAAATESMKAQAQSLLESVSRFRLDEAVVEVAPAGDAAPVYVPLPALALRGA